MPNRAELQRHLLRSFLAMTAGEAIAIPESGLVIARSAATQQSINLPLIG